MKNILNKPLSFITNSVIVLVLFIVFLYPLLLANNHYLAYYEDDFYYYLKIAINWIEKGFPTFDGSIPTNGYHPLWLLILTSVVAIFGKGKLFFVALSSLIIVINLITLKYLRAFLNLVLDNKIHIEVAVLISMYKMINLCLTGMEVIITVPLILLLNLYIQKKFNDLNYLYLGLLISLVVLSRIDTFLYILCLFPFLVRNKKINVNDTLLFLLGLLPIVVYLTINKLNFQTYFPVSGSAKQMRLHYFPNIQILKELYIRNFHTIVFHSLPLLISLIVIFSKSMRNKIKLQKALFYSFTIYTVIYFPLMSIISGWRFWHWYFFPFFFVIMFSFILFDNLRYIGKGFEKQINKLFWVFVVLMIFWSINHRFFRKIETYPGFADAIGVSKFINHNPGRYGMGDRAGLISYLSNQPIFQLEGLVEDAKYLQKIKSSRDLREIFEAYKLDYYISYDMEFDKISNKYIAIEPIIAYEVGNKYLTTIMNYDKVFEFKAANNIYFVYNLNKKVN